MKKAGLVLPCLILLVLCACGQGMAYTVSETLAAGTSLAAQDALYTPGAYSATEEGYGGSITVTMTFDETAITGIEITAENETRDVGTKAMDALAPRILQAQGTGVDAVATATVTSDAIKAAVDSCIAQASQP